MASVQYRIQLDDTTVKELQKIARECGEATGPQLAAKLIRKFLPFYKRLKRAEMRLLDLQLNAIDEHIKQILADENTSITNKESKKAPK